MREFQARWLAHGEREKAKQKASGKPLIIPQTTLALKRNGTPFVSLVLEAYRAEAITLSDASSFLGLKVKHFPKLEKQLHQRAS